MPVLKDMGPAKFDLEGSYRRGYHQGVFFAASFLASKPNATPEQLLAWVEEAGMHWRKDVSLDRQIEAPSFD